MLDTSPRAEAPLRVSDLVPLRRMLGAHSMVIRVNPDGTLVPFEILPAIFYGRPIRQLLSDEVKRDFDAACQQAAAECNRVAFRPDGLEDASEVMITPIIADDSTDCRFLVCWARGADESTGGRSASSEHCWEDLCVDDVMVRYCNLSESSPSIVEAAPWWLIDDADPIELWEHHSHVTAVGLGQQVMARLIEDASAEICSHRDDTQVRIAIPSSELLAQVVPTFHGALRACNLNPARLVVAIPVELAVDPDLLPVIVHLRTMGLQIDIVGLDALTATLQNVCQSSTPQGRDRPVESAPPSWMTSISGALKKVAVTN